MSLYHTHRPDSLDKMKGNKQTIQALKSSLNKEDPPHAFLLTGPSGCGKTTIARIIRQYLRCSEIDYHEIDSADFRGIDHIREIRRRASKSPMDGPCQVWLLDEAHMIGRGGDSSKNEAQNALLKALEDTPSHVYFILATTNPEQLLKTVRNRCSQFSVGPLDENVMFKWLKRIIRSEKKKVPDDVLEQICDDSLGSPRSALVILDKIIDLDPESMIEAAKQQAEKENEIIELCRILMKANSWKPVAKVLKNLNQDPETIRRSVLAYFSTVLLNSGSEKSYLIIDSFREPFFNSGKPGVIAACYEIIKG